MTYYYLKDEGDATAAPVYIVNVGRSKREQKALAEISVAALLSSDIYFCRFSRESSDFITRLFWQNPNREFYRCTAVKLRAIMENRANAADVENLSQQVRSRRMYTAVATHDGKHNHLVSPTILQSYATIINHRKSRC